MHCLLYAVPNQIRLQVKKDKKNVKSSKHMANDFT